MEEQTQGNEVYRQAEIFARYPWLERQWSWIEHNRLVKHDGEYTRGSVDTLFAEIEGKVPLWKVREGISGAQRVQPRELNAKYPGLLININTVGLPLYLVREVDVTRVRGILLQWNNRGVELEARVGETSRPMTIGIEGSVTDKRSNDRLSLIRAAGERKRKGY